METWIVNTNSGNENNHPQAFKRMLRQHKAAAFYSRGAKIDEIKKGDLVLLYHNENRVIAVGAVLSPFEGQVFEEMDHIEHFADVNWIWKANFDDNFEPTDPIDRREVGVTLVREAVNNVTKQVDYKKLFEEIAKRQSF